MALLCQKKCDGQFFSPEGVGSWTGRTDDGRLTSYTPPGKTKKKREKAIIILWDTCHGPPSVLSPSSVQIITIHVRRFPPPSHVITAERRNGRYSPSSRRPPFCPPPPFANCPRRTTTQSNNEDVQLLFFSNPSSGRGGAINFKSTPPTAARARPVMRKKNE